MKKKKLLRRRFKPIKKIWVTFYTADGEIWGMASLSKKESKKNSDGSSGFEILGKAVKFVRAKKARK